MLDFSGLTPECPHALVAYFGLGEAASLQPYFFALMSIAGAALIAVLQWPFVALVRCLRSSKSTAEPNDTAELNDTAAAANGEETPLVGGRAISEARNATRHDAR